MTIKNGHLSKQLVFYPPVQPSLENELPLWLEEEEEDEVYSSLICTLDATIRRGQPDEDDLIKKILKNKPPNTRSLEALVKKIEDNPWIDLFLVDSCPIHIKII